MKTKTVYRFYVDYEKEEKWLNEMAAQGWLLERFKVGRYVFCEGEPDAYMYRIELLEELPSHPKSKAYFDFLEEMEIEVVETSFRWIFLRKRTEDGPFHLYSDFDSMIRHERSILKLYSLVLFINLAVVFINLPNSMTGWIILPNLAVVLMLSHYAHTHHRKIRTLKGLREISEQRE